MLGNNMQDLLKQSKGLNFDCLFKSLSESFPQQNIYFGSVIKGKVLITNSVTETKEDADNLLNSLYSKEVQDSLGIKVQKLTIGIINE